jgi:hypothetical protein
MFHAHRYKQGFVGLFLMFRAKYYWAESKDRPRIVQRNQHLIYDLKFETRSLTKITLEHLEQYIIYSIFIYIKQGLTSV